MSKQIGIGVAGAGVFGGFHASKYAAHENANLLGVFDIDPSCAKNLAAQFGATPFANYERMIERVDAVVITAPASNHFDLALQALEMGRHVFVEKPIALTTQEADALIAGADTKNKILQVGHQERYVFAAAGLLDRDCAPVKIDCIRCAAASGRCEDVSVVFDLMVHDLDLVRQLTGAEINALSATGDRDDISADLTLSNGTIVILKACRRASFLDRRMVLVYEDGVIEMDFVKREIVNSTPENLPTDFSGDDAPLAFSDPLGYGADLFITAILNGTPPVVAGRDGRIAVDWASRIEKAASISVDNMRDTPERLRA